MKENTIKTNIFFIRNFFCVISSQNIILQYKIQNPVAFIINRDSNRELVEAINRGLNHSIWHEIRILDLYARRESPITKKKKQDFYIIKNVVHKNLSSYDMESIFITVANDGIEKYAYYYAKKNKIFINKYEEGLNHYTEPEHLENVSILRRIMRFLRYPNHRYYLLNEGICNYNNVFSVFPNFLKKNNYDQHLPVNLNLENSARDINNGVALILTGPYSDGEGMTETEEFNYFNKLLESLPHGIKLIVKPHPREKRDKLERFCHRFNCKLVNDDYINLPAEILIRDSHFQYIVGFWSSSLLYATKISPNSKVISAVKTLKEKYFFLENELKMFSEERITCI